MALETLFNDIAAAIHEKDGKTDGIAAKDFPARIRAIPTGIGGVQLESIEITAPPLKTNYYVGDAFDPTGMVVYATYSNGQSMYVNLSNLTFDPAGPLEESTTSVTVNFQWGLKMVSAVQPISVVAVMCFGVMWDYGGKHTELTRLTPYTDPNGYVTATVDREAQPAVGDGPGSSPFDAYLPWSGMEEYNIINSSVSYKRGEEGFSRTRYDTVVYIPEFWYDCIDDSANSKRYWYISDRPLEGMEKHPGGGKYLARYRVNRSYQSVSGSAFHSGQVSSAIANCSSKGNKFYLSDERTWSAVQLLYLIEFANWDSQAKNGNGVYGTYIPSGASDIMDYHTGKVSESEWPQIQYRHIEGIYGNALEMIDGLKVDSNKNILASIDNQNYIAIGGFSGVDGADSSSIDKLIYNNSYKFVFAPEHGVSGMDGPIPDSTSIRKDVPVLLGGYYPQKLYGGLFCFYSSGGGSTNYGYRYVYDPNKE